MSRKIILLACTAATLCCKGLAQSTYRIAPPTRAEITPVTPAPAFKDADVAVYALERSERTIAVAAPVDKKTRKKARKKSAPTVEKTVTAVSARKTSARYDANVPLRNGFTLTLWAKPDAVQGESSGYIFFPLEGLDVNGAMQAQWGLTADKEHVRVYERQGGERLILEFRHDEGQEFFIALTCRNNTPALYINGELVSTGLTSLYHAHPAFEGAALCPAAKRFAGTTAEVHYFDTSLSDTDIRGLFKTEYLARHGAE